jgi:hypothetical protein
MKKVIVKGITCVFYENHELSQVSYMETTHYPHEYGVRHPDNNWDKPTTIEYVVLANRLGKLYASKKLIEKGYMLDVKKVTKAKGYETWAVSPFKE